LPVTRRGVRVLARAPGHGLAWATVDPDATRAEVDVRLPPEGRIAGKVVDLQGAAVVGLAVHARRPARKGDGGAALPLPNAVVTAKTDDGGRFTFPGLGPNVTAHLEIDDVRFAPKELDVDTADRAKAEHVLLALPPGQVLEGRVVYADTGK